MSTPPPTNCPCGGVNEIFLEDIDGRETWVTTAWVDIHASVSIYSECDECGARREAEGGAKFSVPLEWKP